MDDAIGSVFRFLNDRHLSHIYKASDKHTRNLIEEWIWKPRVHRLGYSYLLPKYSIPEALFVVGPGLEGQGLLREKDIMLLHNAVPKIIKTGRLRDWHATARVVKDCLCLRFANKCDRFKGTISKSGTIWYQTERRGRKRLRTSSQHPRPFFPQRVGNLLRQALTRSQ